MESMGRLESYRGESREGRAAKARWSKISETSKLGDAAFGVRGDVAIHKPSRVKFFLVRRLTAGLAALERVKQT